MKRYDVKITGQTPLLLHNDNLDWADRLKDWAKVPANKKQSVAGDDRSPAWRWLGCLYVTGTGVDGVLSVSSDNIATMLREGGAKCPTGKKTETYKRLTQSGLIIDSPDWPLIVDGREIPFRPFADLEGETDFSAHEKLAEKFGFELFKKRAKIGTKKHVRVRPRFDRWQISGTITAIDASISRDVLEMILTHAGAYCGLGDWRPSSPQSPGAFGRFSATVKEV